MSDLYCSLCGNENHDVYDGVLDCGHSIEADRGCALVDADELRVRREEEALDTRGAIERDADEEMARIDREWAEEHRA